jgi:hypothetical protein
MKDFNKWKDDGRERNSLMIPSQLMHTHNDFESKIDTDPTSTEREKSFGQGDENSI